MNCNIVVSSVFERSAKKLAKRYSSFRDDFMKFISELKNDPFVGADLGHGLRKVRMAVSLSMNRRLNDDFFLPHPSSPARRFFENSPVPS